MKNLSKIISISLVCVILFIIVVSSCIKVNNKYKSKKFDSMVLKIEEEALNCYNDGKCTEEKIYLKELYEKEYLDEMINPTNNEYLNEESYVTINSKNSLTLTIID